MRVRPLVGRELLEGGERHTCVNVFEDDNQIMVGKESFQFERVFSRDTPQSRVFEICAKNSIIGCFEGYNATVIAYG